MGTWKVEACFFSVESGHGLPCKAGNFCQLVAKTLEICMNLLQQPPKIFCCDNNALYSEHRASQFCDMHLLVQSGCSLVLPLSKRSIEFPLLVVHLPEVLKIW
jgi:hypothetical protein